MASIASYNDIINRIGGEYVAKDHFFFDGAGSTATVLSGNLLNKAKFASSLPVLPSLPTGVSAFVPVSIDAVHSHSTGHSVIVGKGIDLGTLDISGPTFTDGSSMPTETVGGVSTTISSPIYMEVTTALNATPGSITVTYVDQDGNTAETTTAQALSASSLTTSLGLVTLNGTDWGARDITTATRTGGTAPTGVVKFWGIIPLGMFGMPANTGAVESFIGNAFNILRLGASDRLIVISLGITGARGMEGSIFYVGDST